RDITRSIDEHQDDKAAGSSSNIPPILRRSRIRRMHLLGQIKEQSSRNNGDLLLADDSNRDRGRDMHKQGLQREQPSVATGRRSDEFGVGGDSDLHGAG
ncbi:hypothetical protein LINPERHAP2_LOCUS29163, partial [Linum perenne]